MSNENIPSVVIDGVRYTGWQSFSIRRSLDSFCGSFSMQLVNIEQPGIVSPTDKLSINSRCEIFIGNDQFMNAYIFQRSRSSDAKSTDLSISGRDITADMIDSSAVIASNSWSNASLKRIVEDVAKPFGVYVDSRIGNGTTFKSFAIQQGESSYECIDRATKQNGNLAVTNRFGDIVLMTVDPKSEVTTMVDLVYGENIKSISEDLDYSERFETYYVKGQDSGNGNEWTKSQLQKVGVANDKAITRHRPLIIVSDSKASAKLVKDRASWEAQIRAGRSTTYTVTVQGFRQNPRLGASNNPFWEIGDLVNLIHSGWGINKKFVVAEIDYSYDTSGTLTTMKLRDPKTYAADPEGLVTF